MSIRGSKATAAWFSKVASPTLTPEESEKINYGDNFARKGNIQRDKCGFDLNIQRILKVILNSALDIWNGNVSSRTFLI
jgi:hypothetical protein